MNVRTYDRTIEQNWEQAQWIRYYEVNWSEISTYENINFGLKNVQNVLGILLKTILKFRNIRFSKNFYSKNCRIQCSGTLGGKINIDNESENFKIW